MRLFRDRRDAGRQLAAALLREPLHNPVVIAVPRGGVPVAYEVARALGAPLEVVLVRKLGAPFQPELAVGAIADGEPPLIEIDPESARISGADAGYIKQEVARQSEILRRRRRDFGAFLGSAALENKTAVLVDDGIATGATVRAALHAVQVRHPQMVVLALPVAPAQAVAELRRQVNRLLCLDTPSFFTSVGSYYEDFRQVDDTAVISLLRAAHGDCEHVDDR